jgi:hypothetical protein
MKNLSFLLYPSFFGDGADGGASMDYSDGLCDCSGCYDVSNAPDNSVYANCSLNDGIYSHVYFLLSSLSFHLNKKVTSFSRLYEVEIAVQDSFGYQRAIKF